MNLDFFSKHSEKALEGFKQGNYMTKLAFCKDSSGYQVEEILWGGIRVEAGRQVRSTGPGEALVS